MSHTVNVDDLVIKAKRFADLLNSNFAKDQEVIDMLNDSWKELYSLVVAENESIFHADPAGSISVVSGTSVYALPSDLYKLRGLDVLSNGRYRTIKRRPERMRNVYTQYWGDRPRFYVLQGNNVEFFPQPTGSYTVRVRYVPVPEDMVSGGTVDVVNGWDRYLCLDVAALLRGGKEGGDAGVLIDMRERALQRILDTIQPRSTDPEEATDCDLVDAYDNDILGWA